MDRSVYLEPLKEFTALCDSLPTTRQAAFLRVFYLVNVTMRYENAVEFSKDLPDHPYAMTGKILEDAAMGLKGSAEILFTENEATRDFEKTKSHAQEEKHETLWTELWPEYKDRLHDEYVARYRHRIAVNDLDGLMAGARCIDAGCGNGGFLFAALEAGAASVAGVDFGVESVEHARAVAKARGVEDRAEFHISPVYTLPFEDGTFDFGFQNGVFHHLDDQDKAIAELARVIKPGGHIWYYVDGAGAIKSDLFDTGVHILRDIPTAFVVQTLSAMNISQGKITHLTDGLNATYAKATWDGLTEQLARHGFDDFRRVVGGFPTDFDHDVVEADPYGREKYGEGNLRLVARKSD